MVIEIDVWVDWVEWRKYGLLYMLWGDIISWDKVWFFISNSKKLSLSLFILLYLLLGNIINLSYKLIVN